MMVSKLNTLHKRELPSWLCPGYNIVESELIRRPMLFLERARIYLMKGLTANVERGS